MPDASDPDLLELFAFWLGAPLAESRREALLERLRSDPQFRAVFADEVRLLGMIQAVRAAAPRWLRLEDELGWSSEEAAPEFGDAVAARIAELPSRPRRRLRWAVGAAAVAAVGVLILLLLPANKETRSGDRIAYVVSLTGTVWEGEGPAEKAVVGSGILSLREGSATLALFNGVTVYMEAPATVDLQSAERLHCRSGKLRIDSPAEATGFTVTTKGAEISPAADFALTVDEGGSTAVAVFDGRANVSVLDRSGQATRSESLVGGQAVQIDGGTLQTIAQARLDNKFAGPIPTITPPLPLSPNYAQVVLADRPTNYWRFESVSNRTIPNEVANGSPLRLIGDAELGERVGGNRSLSLPPPNEEEQHGAISEGTWTPRDQNYTVECWAMSRVVRQSAIVGVVTAGANKTVPADRHGLLLELTGQPSPFRHPPRATRLLHRLPPGKGRGVNLFSPGQYLPYSWQHIVLRQSGSRLELYLNGELSGLGSPSAAGSLPACRVLLGALHVSQDGNSCSGRPFVGLIDEVGVYDHALSPEAILRHYTLGTGNDPK